MPRQLKPGRNIFSSKPGVTTSFTQATYEDFFCEIMCKKKKNLKMMVWLLHSSFYYFIIIYYKW